MNDLLIFVYSRGDQFKVTVTVNEMAGSMVYHDFIYPKDTSIDVKRAFLDEADVAVTKQVNRLTDESLAVGV
jgi:hypothetical protein